jgi:hypothetical protein
LLTVEDERRHGDLRARPKPFSNRQDGDQSLHNSRQISRRSAAIARRPTPVAKYHWYQ